MKPRNHFAAAAAFAFLLVFPPGLRADGQYRILVDDTGVYLQTEDGGGWYIPEEDQRFFRPGQAGRYRMGRDARGDYLETEHGRFHLGGGEPAPGEGDGQSVQSRLKPGTTETDIAIIGQQVIVPVTIRHKGRTVELKLLLDTGASMVTLHKTAVKRLRPARQKTVHFTTAGGQAIPADIVTLDEIRFGPHRLEEVTAGLIDYQGGGPASHFDGLLGMNALHGLNYRIDFERKRIQWLAD